jgi:hypothetical protein
VLRVTREDPLNVRRLLLPDHLQEFGVATNDMSFESTPNP